MSENEAQKYEYNKSISGCIQGVNIFDGKESNKNENIIGKKVAYITDYNTSVCIIGSILIASNSSFTANSIHPYFETDNTIKTLSKTASNPSFSIASPPKKIHADYIDPITKLTCKEENSACKFHVIFVPYSTVNGNVGVKTLISTSQEGSIILKNYQNGTKKFTTQALLASKYTRKFTYNETQTNDFTVISPKNIQISNTKTLLVKSNDNKLNNDILIEYKIVLHSSKSKKNLESNEEEDWLFPSIIGTLPFEGGLFTLDNFDSNSKFDKHFEYVPENKTIPSYCNEVHDTVTMPTNLDEKPGMSSIKKMLIICASVGAVFLVALIVSVSLVVYCICKKKKKSDIYEDPTTTAFEV